MHATTDRDLIPPPGSINHAGMPSETIKQRRRRLAKKLEEYRIAADLSQEEAGKLAGVPQRTWSRWESGGASIEAVIGGFEALGYRVETVITKVSGI